MRLRLSVLLVAAVSSGAAAFEMPELDAPGAEVGGAAIRAMVETAEVRVEVSGDPSGEGGAEFPEAVAQVAYKGAPALRLRTVEGGSSAMWARATIVEMDASNGAPEVVLEAYTGGAHCCVEARIATRTATGWVEVPGGARDGDGSKLADLDGDGTAEIVSPDNDFLYAFGCYACSVAPLKIEALSGDALVDVSFEPRFRDAHRAYLESLEGSREGAPRRGRRSLGRDARQLRPRSDLGPGVLPQAGRRPGGLRGRGPAGAALPGGAEGVPG